MKKELKDYLHLYLGCEVMTPDGIGWLASVSRDRKKMDGLLLSTMIKVDFKTIRLTENSVDGYDKKRNHGAYLIEAEHYVGINASAGTPPDFSMPGGCKPILRPLSDMSEDECFELGEILNVHIPDHLIEALKNNSKYVIDFRYSFEFTRYLLSKHFDLFGLIEAGLAIDKTK